MDLVHGRNEEQRYRKVVVSVSKDYETHIGGRLTQDEGERPLQIK